MRSCERGAALVITLMAMLLLSAIGAGLVLSTSADALIAANTGAAIEASYAAEAMFERTAAELREAPTFTAVLSGAAGSLFVDGPASGTRTLPDGTRVDLTQVVNLANCGKPTSCSDADLNATTVDRLWGPRNPRWQLFSYGTFDSPADSGWSGAPLYVVSMVADDPLETDGSPAEDGLPTGPLVNPGAGLLSVRTEAFGRRGAHRVLEGTVARRDLVAFARWKASDPLTRGPAPAGAPALQLVGWQELK